MGAYQYGRPHVGQQALYANALLTRQDALGYVTELLSGDYNTAFGRSSHHQIWSEAMVVSPLVRGLLGLDVADGGRHVTLAPQLPATGRSVQVRTRRRARTGSSARFRRRPDAFVVSVDGLSADALTVAPALPLDAVVTRATVDGEEALFTD